MYGWARISSASEQAAFLAGLADAHALNQRRRQGYADQVAQAHALHQGRRQGYEAAMQDVADAARLAHATELRREYREHDRERRGRFEEERRGSVRESSRGRAPTPHVKGDKSGDQDDFDRYRHHKAEHQEYGHKLGAKSDSRSVQPEAKARVTMAPDARTKYATYKAEAAAENASQRNKNEYAQPKASFHHSGRYSDRDSTKSSRHSYHHHDRRDEPARVQVRHVNPEWLRQQQQPPLAYSSSRTDREVVGRRAGGRGLERGFRIEEERTLEMRGFGGRGRRGY